MLDSYLKLIGSIRRGDNEEVVGLYREGWKPVIELPIDYRSFL